jgi:hypothetical protein
VGPISAQVLVEWRLGECGDKLVGVCTEANSVMGAEAADFFVYWWYLKILAVGRPVGGLRNGLLMYVGKSVLSTLTLKSCVIYQLLLMPLSILNTDTVCLHYSNKSGFIMEIQPLRREVNFLILGTCLRTHTHTLSLIKYIKKSVTEFGKKL